MSLGGSQLGWGLTGWIPGRLVGAVHQEDPRRLHLAALGGSMEQAAPAALKVHERRILREAFFGLPPTGKEPETLSTLHQHFARLLEVADGADGAATSQSQAVYEELQAALESLTARWDYLKKTDLPALNARLRRAGLPAVSLGSTSQPSSR